MDGGERQQLRLRLRLTARGWITGLPAVDSLGFAVVRTGCDCEAAGRMDDGVRK
jgi:hypothetical protein